MLVLGLLPLPDLAGSFRITIWLSTVLLISGILFKLLESPAIALGNKWASAKRQPKPLIN